MRSKLSKMPACLMTAVFITLPCTAVAEAPDPARFIANAQEVGTLSAIVKMCQRADYVVAPDFYERTTEAVIAQGIGDGLSEEVVYQVVNTSIESSAAIEKAWLADFSKKLAAVIEAGDKPATQATFARWFSYVDGKCAGFAASPQLRKVISAPAAPGYKNFVAGVLQLMTSK